MPFVNFIWDPGDWLIHSRYGIGRYIGMKSVSIEDTQYECVGIQCNENSTTWIPTLLIAELGYYAHGSKTIAGKKNVIKKISEYKQNAKLWSDLFIQQEQIRLKTRMTPLNIIPYEEYHNQLTNDQRQCLNDICKDLSSGSLMDRVICGDVCTGKTEIAIQAARIILHNNGQVVLLSPTTILTQQHYKSFQARFPNEKIACATRATENIEEIIQGCKDGDIKILITTHGVVRNKKWSWKNLMLNIVDEEHCFGVNDKERIKFVQSHHLSMSASPLPKTVSMALNGMRSISILEEMPAGKKVAQTHIVENINIASLIKKTGQVLCVCRKIRSIPTLIQEIKNQLAEHQIEVPIFIAHGKMDPKDVQNNINQFKCTDGAILVSTALVGVGIDEESIHTLVVFDAHHWGLSQLHQLRGRVSRSADSGLAYFVAPLHTDCARLRLLMKHQNTGAGWILAQKDMEMRGAGSTTGVQQSGHNIDIGLDLFNSLMADAREECTLIDLHKLRYSIPTQYIPNTEERLYWYKYLAQIATQLDLERAQQKLEAQYKEIPSAMKDYWKLIQLRIKAQQIGIQSISSYGNNAQIIFYNKARQALHIHIETLKDLEDILDNIATDIEHYTQITA